MEGEVRDLIRPNSFRKINAIKANFGVLKPNQARLIGQKMFIGYVPKSSHRCDTSHDSQEGLMALKPAPDLQFSPMFSIDHMMDTAT